MHIAEAELSGIFAIGAILFALFIVIIILGLLESLKIWHDQ